MKTRYPWQNQAWQQWQQQTNRIAHAYLLKGPAGIGMGDLALDIAKGLLCSQPVAGSACGHCTQCRHFEQQVHPDFFNVQVLEDKKEISITQIRALTDQIYTTAHQGGYKVALIEQVERLNTSAFNALLKTLEEPPANTVMILTAYQASLLPATIVSRCRQIQCAPPSFEQATEWLTQQCEGVAPSLLKRALDVSWGAPLAAFAWLQNKRNEEEQVWQSDMQRLQAGQLSIAEAVDKWQKFADVQTVIDYFYLRSVSAIRAALFQQKVALNPNWFEFQKSALQARQMWHQNINKELLLATLCLEWLNCSGANFETAEAFLPKQIRGKQI